MEFIKGEEKMMMVSNKVNEVSVKQFFTLLASFNDKTITQLAIDCGRTKGRLSQICSDNKSVVSLKVIREILVSQGDELRIIIGDKTFTGEDAVKYTKLKNLGSNYVIVLGNGCKFRIKSVKR